jgi:hypothetical protein
LLLDELLVLRQKRGAKQKIVKDEKGHEAVRAEVCCLLFEEKHDYYWALS